VDDIRRNLEVVLDSSNILSIHTNGTSGKMQLHKAWHSFDIKSYKINFFRFVMVSLSEFSFSFMASFFTYKTLFLGNFQYNIPSSIINHNEHANNNGTKVQIKAWFSVHSLVLWSHFPITFDILEVINPKQWIKFTAQNWQS
jgi:hypothetical protein